MIRWCELTSHPRSATWIRRIRRTIGGPGWKSHSGSTRSVALRHVVDLKTKKRLRREEPVVGYCRARGRGDMDASARLSML